MNIKYQNPLSNYPNPRKLPIIGRQPPHVSQRPRCPGCGAALKPILHLERTSGRPQHRYWYGATADKDGLYDSYGHFHSLTCGTEWANRVIRSGLLSAYALQSLVKNPS